MKKIKLTALLIAIVAINFSCQTTSPDRSIGFTNWSDDGETYKWHLGTDKAVDLVVELDKVWSAQDYTKMRTFFADTAKFYHRNGKSFNNTNDFINYISEGSSTTEWKFTSAYSVDLDPSRGGEHVQAGFELSTKSGDSIIKSEVHEQYYVIDNKIVQWRQFSLPMN